MGLSQHPCLSGKSGLHESALLTLLLLFITHPQIHEKKPLKGQETSLSGSDTTRDPVPTTMYKEFRALSPCRGRRIALPDMAARHRARFASIHILKIAEIEKSEDVKRPYIKQLMLPVSSSPSLTVAPVTLVPSLASAPTPSINRIVSLTFIINHHVCRLDRIKV